MTDVLAIIAIAISIVSAATSIVSAVIAWKAKVQAHKAATLAPRGSAINHLHEALRGLAQPGWRLSGDIQRETPIQIKKALNLADLVFSPQVRSKLGHAHTTARRLLELRLQGDVRPDEVLALEEGLQRLLAQMNKEASI